MSFLIRRRSAELHDFSSAAFRWTYLWRKSPIFKEPQQVGILSVHISANFNRRAQLQQHGLRHEHVPRHGTQLSRVLSGQLHGRARLLTTSAQQQINNAIEPAFADRPASVRGALAHADGDAGSRLDSVILSHTEVSDLQDYSGCSVFQ
jgi:hypothetical protein